MYINTTVTTITTTIIITSSIIHISVRPQEEAGHAWSAVPDDRLVAGSKNYYYYY